MRQNVRGISLGGRTRKEGRKYGREGEWVDEWTNGLIDR